MALNNVESFSHYTQSSNGIQNTEYCEVTLLVNPKPQSVRSRWCRNIHILRDWKKWIRPLVFVLYLIIFFVVLPISIYDLNRHDVPLHKEAWFVGGVFTLMAIPISLWGILQHMVNYTKPELQRYIIRILWMVPIYALNAWLALRFPDSAIYLDVIRECYEAYVIYNFMSYLLMFLSSEYADLSLMLENKPRIKHLIPICCLPPWPMGQRYIDRCKHGVLQYTIIRPTMTVAAVLCEMTNSYGEGNFDPTKGWMYITIINNISQILAMYCLVMFYRATKEELSPIKPVPKFMCVKAVVFLSFWQSVLLAILGSLGVLTPGTLEFEVKTVAAGIQDFLICIEMFLAAIAHYFSFSHRPFVTTEGGRINCCQSFLSMWDISDVGEDVAEHISYVSDRVRNTVRLRSQKFANGENENMPLLVKVDLAINYNTSDVNNSKVTDRPIEFPTHNEPLDVADPSSSIDTESLYCSLDIRHDQVPAKVNSPSLNNYLDTINDLVIVDDLVTSHDSPDNGRSSSYSMQHVTVFDEPSLVNKTHMGNLLSSTCESPLSTEESPTSAVQPRLSTEDFLLPKGNTSLTTQVTLLSSEETPSSTGYSRLTTTDSQISTNQTALPSAGTLLDT